MTLRLTAVAAAVVIAIALIAAYLAGHAAQTGEVPAGSAGAVAAYQQLIKTDYDAWQKEPFNCVRVTDAACVHDLAVNRAILVKWRSDLASFNTPSQFAVIDGQIKRHLESGIRVADVAATAINTHNQALFDAGGTYATDAADWLRRVSAAITATRAVSASRYNDLRQTEYSINFGDQSTPMSTCASLQDALCRLDQTAATQGIGQMQADFVQYQAPAALAGQELKLQKDLAQADNALMQTGEALVNNDAAGFQLGRTAYSNALTAVSSDLQS